MRADHVLAHVLRMGARVVDTLDALDAVEKAKQLGEGSSLMALPAGHPSRGAAGGYARRRQVAPIGVHVLAEQRHLAHTVGGHRPNLRHELARWPADLAPTRRRNDAVGAGAIAPHADLHPSLERALPARRQMTGEPLKLEVPLRGERVAQIGRKSRREKGG